MREVAGIAIVVVAVAIAPAGHFWSPVWWGVSFGLAVIGLLLFLSERLLKREKRDRELNSSGDAGENRGLYAPGPLHPGGVRRESTGSSESGGDLDGE